MDVSKLGGRWNRCGMCGDYIVEHVPGTNGSACSKCSCVRPKPQRRGMDVASLDDLEALA